MRSRLSDEEREARARERSRRTWAGESYRTYDTSTGFGSRQDWEAAAERLAFSKSILLDNTEVGDEYLLALGLKRTPNDPHDVLVAFRRRAMETHPDRGGSEAEFKKVYAAYEKVMARYQ